MKRKVAKLRLSPNEEARIIREEHERRRKLRIQQVREQQRYIALQIRREVEQRRQRELEQLEQELREDWERQQREKLHALQRLYQESLQLVGQGHRSAKENEPDLEAIAQREEENHVKAEERYREALKELKSQRIKDDERQSRSINARRKALQAEKERSAKVASLPPPLPNPIQSIDSKKPCIVKKSDVSAFAATHYHMPESTVDREADSNQLNAHEDAELEVRRLQDLQREEKRRREEQLEKARLRGKEALRREHLVQDRERLLVELEHMQQTDLLRRRQQVSQMPPQIFQPLLKRQEMREDFQREMEFAFEDMYTGERRVKGDLVVQLVPEPLPAASTGSQDQELDISLDEIATQEAVTTARDAEREAGSTEEEASAQAESFKPAPRRALKKLLDRIRSQRTQWTDPAADSPTAITAQIPERDTTIDTGSLTSEENAPLPPMKLPEPAHSPPASETTEQSTAAGPPLPDGLASRVQEFEEERKRREKELDREKQQQIVLLKELEEQKAKLEQMLLEAQQEREDLKAVVTQDEPVSQPEVPVHEQEVTSVTLAVATEVVPSTGEDDHTRRIKQYQQRLLEQNRIHQRSVEVARRRLEEYQRALQIRYSMTAASSVPPSFIHPPLHGSQFSHLPASSQFLTTPAATAYIHAKPQPPAEFPPREPYMSALPARLPSPGPSASHGSQLSPQDKVGFFPSDPLNREPDVTAWLTDNIMQRVMEHLPERARPFSEPLPHKRIPTHHSASIPTHHSASIPTHHSASIPTHHLASIPTHHSASVPTHHSASVPTHHSASIPTHHSASIPTQPTSDPIQAISPPIIDVVPLVERGHAPNGSPSSREDEDDDMESQRRELLEVQRRVLDQREAVALQQRRREEERQRREEQRRTQEAEMEQMRRQKEALQTLIHTEEHLDPEAASEVLVSEDIGQTRLKLLASLLRAIEESNGGTLSHLEDPQEEDGSPPQQPSDSGETDLICPSDVPAGPASAFPSGLFPPPRAAKPPVTRIRLGAMEMMTAQHELSAIQEVETPVNASQVAGPLEDSATVPSHGLDWDRQEDSESSTSSDGNLQTPSWSSGGQWTSERSNGCGTSLEKSCHLWRERLLIGAETSPESSGSDSVLRMIAPLSSDSGRGADYSGPAATSNRPSTESTHRTPDPDCHSSTSISTGSYITTDPELNIDVDKSPPLGHCAKLGQGADLLNVSSPSAQSSRIEDSSAADRPGLAVASLFTDSSIQHIIDRYTRELNISLNAAGKTTDSEGSYVEEPGSSFSQQAWVRVSERRGEDESSLARRSLPSDTAGAQRSGLDWHNTVNPIPEHFSDEDPSLDEEQDSFRPLIGQLAEQSSCLAADQRDSAMEQLVGHPSAHSSMIGQLPGPAVLVSFDHGGWDSTLSRLIGRLSHQSSSHWLSGGQDFYAGQLTGRVASEQSTTWLDGGPGESRMRPLVVELDESAGQHSGSSAHVDLGVSTEARVPAYPALPPEASQHSASGPGVNPQPQDQPVQNQTRSMDLDPRRTEASVFPDSDSFHPLLAEVTHNETADPSMIFHLPEHDVPTSPEGQPASGENSVSASSEEFEARADPSVESEPSPEHLRAEDPSGCAAASPTSIDSSQLLTSQCHPDESVLMLSPAGGPDMEPTARSLSHLTMCDDAPPVDMPQPEGVVANRNHVWPFLDKMMEAAGEKGILEQSEITLVSLTDTTLQDQETTDTEEGGMWDDEPPDGVGQEGQQAQETEMTEGFESTSLQDGTPEDKNHTHPDPVTLLEFQWGSSRGLQEVHQQKRRALLQRSSRRVEEIKAKGALAKVQPESRAPPEAREQSKAEQSKAEQSKAEQSKAKESKAKESKESKAKESKPDPCKAKTKSETQHKADTKSKGTHTEPHRTIEKSVSKQKKTQLPPPVVEVRNCTPEQRKRDVSEMHRRTQRLYEQLDEVKCQKAIRNRQQAYATNRVKAKEFHKKTLQKLRAKQTLNVS